MTPYTWNSSSYLKASVLPAGRPVISGRPASSGCAVHDTARASYGRRERRPIRRLPAHVWLRSDPHWETCRKLLFGPIEEIAPVTPGSQLSGPRHGGGPQSCKALVGGVAATRFAMTCRGGHREWTVRARPLHMCVMWTGRLLGRRVELQFRWQNFGRRKCPATCASRVSSHRVLFSHSRCLGALGPAGGGAACSSGFSVCARRALPCHWMATCPSMTAPSRPRTRDHWRCGGSIARAPGTGARPRAGPRVAVVWSCPWRLPHLMQ